MKLKRRGFIRLITVGTVGVAAGGYISFSDFDDLVRHIVTEDTKTLNIDPEVIDRFISDAQSKNMWSGLSFSKKQLIKWSTYLNNPLFSLPYTAKYNRYRSGIVGLFLLSTTFFQDKMNEGKPI